MNVALVILSKNEEEIISQVIEGVFEEISRLSGYSIDVYLWDDSNDQTKVRAEKMGVKALQGGGRGLGYSYYKALSYFSKQEKFDLLVTMDGDGQVDPKELPLFLQALREGADMVVGSRFQKNNMIYYSYPWLNYFGVKVLALIISLGTRQLFTDSHGGFRVMKIQVLQGIRFLGTHSYVQETIMDIISRGYKVKEISSVWKPRVVGDSRVVHYPWRYARRMFIPLMLRISMHWALGLIFLILALVSNPYWLIGFVVAIFLEFYKRNLFSKNLRSLSES